MESFCSNKLYVVFLLLVVTLLEARTIKVASYNVENLFDMSRSGLEYNEYTPSRHNWTEATLRKKLINISEVICDVDADVIALQEVESDVVLVRLQKMLKRVGCAYGYRAITSDTKTTIHNAILSKIKLKKYRDIKVGRGSRRRSILEVSLLMGTPLRIFVNHWRSKAGPESQRIPYAKALSHGLAKLPSDTSYILLGDFNSNYAEYRTISQKHNDTKGKTGINHILRTIKNGKLVRLHNLDKNYHYNLWLELDSYARWSHNYYGSKEALDAILIPARLYDGVGWEYLDGSFGVYKPDYLFGKKGQIYRWQYRAGKHLGRGYSDHLPIFASFELKDSSWWDRIFGQKQKSNKRVERASSKSIDISMLYTLSKIATPVVLKDAKVIFKSRDSAVVKQRQNGRSILLYRCANELKEGNHYNLKIYKKSRYYGLDEVTDIEIDEDLGEETHNFTPSAFRPEMMNERRYIGELVSGVEGRYIDGHIEIGGKQISVYFKKWLKRPKSGSYLMLKRAIIGYYKNHNELVVWNASDYEIKE